LQGTILRVAGKSNGIADISKVLRVLHEDVLNDVAMIMSMMEGETFKGPQKPEEEDESSGG
jgi:hypothetical protein